MGSNMSTKLALITAYNKVELKHLDSQMKYDKHTHYNDCLECCDNCIKLSMRVLAFESELDILLENIRSL